MNIKNRLRRLEDAGVGSEFCACPNTRKYEVIECHEGKPDVINVAVADACDACGKAIQKQTIIVEFVKPKRAEWMSNSQYAAACCE